MIEIRANGTLSATGKTLTGHCAVFNSEANLGTFSEVIRPGAFAKSLASGVNVRALYHHDGSALLGTTKGGTLELREDAKGLAFKLALPDTSHGRDLAILVARGDVSGCSFGFRVAPGGDRWQDINGQMVRELLSVDLMEVTLTSDPAYQDTTVAMRNMPSFWDNGDRFVDLNRAWLETA